MGSAFARLNDVAISPLNAHEQWPQFLGCPCQPAKRSQNELEREYPTPKAQHSVKTIYLTVLRSFKRLLIDVLINCIISSDIVDHGMLRSACAAWSAFVVKVIDGLMHDDRRQEVVKAHQNRLGTKLWRGEHWKIASIKWRRSLWNCSRWSAA